RGAAVLWVADEAVGGPPIRPRAQRRDLQLELAREEEVIAVEVLDEVAARGQASGLARQPGPAVLAPDAADLGVPCAKRLDHARRVVGRGVVDDDDLDRTVRLRQRAVH